MNNNSSKSGTKPLLIIFLLILASALLCGSYIFYKLVLHLYVYPSIPARWIAESGETAGDEQRVLHALLSSADRGDVQALSENFTNHLRESDEFDACLDRFFESYPGNMDGIEFTRVSAGGNGTPDGNGNYMCSNYASFVGRNGTDWYYISIKYVDYYRTSDRKTVEDMIGVTSFKIYNAGARAAVHANTDQSVPSFIMCRIRPYDDDEVRIICNDAYMWNPGSSDGLSPAMANELLTGCRDYDDVIEALGRPDAEGGYNSWYCCFYQISSRSADPVYVMVNFDGNSTEIFSVELCDETALMSNTDIAGVRSTDAGSYEVSGSVEVNGRQGVCCGNGHYWVSGSASLTRYDSDWNIEAVNDNPFEGYTSEVNHIGDIDMNGDELFAAVEYFEDGSSSNLQISVYDADSLELLRTYPVDETSGQTECSGIAVDRDSDTIWLCSWASDESGRYLYAYDLNNGEYMGRFEMFEAPLRIQGITYHNGYIYISSDEGDADLNEPDLIYRTRIPPILLYDLNQEARSCVTTYELTLEDVIMQGEIEGLTFDGDNGQLLILYNHGARIVEGMPVGFYDGYDHEISEVIIYDLISESAV